MRALVETSLANSYPPEVRHNAEEFRKFRARWLCQRSAQLRRHQPHAGRRRPVDEVPRIACPTLVIGCTHDKLRPPAAVEPMARQIPGAQYIEINSGHFAAVQTPGLMSQAIHCFLFSLGY